MNLGGETIRNYLGEDRLKEIINFCLKYIADLDPPVKRGTFVEFRAGMLNVSPIGRNCSRPERNVHSRRGIKKLDVVRNLSKSCAKIWRKVCLTFSIGGQISFDVFPNIGIRRTASST